MKDYNKNIIWYTTNLKVQDTTKSVKQKGCGMIRLNVFFFI